MFFQAESCSKNRQYNDGFMDGFLLFIIKALEQKTNV